MRQQRKLLLLAQQPLQTWTCCRLLWHAQVRSVAMVLLSLISGVVS